MAILTKEQWLKRKQRRKKIRNYMKGFFFTSLLIFLILLIVYIKDNVRLYKPNNTLEFLDIKGINVEDLLTIEKQLLTPNEYSRPETPLYEVNSIVVHYTGNPGSTAIGNRNYFENLKTKKTTSASSHYVVGLEGEVIQCIPLNEVAYASNNRNSDTISVETCHPDEEGKFNPQTYDSLVSLVALLCSQYNLKRNDIIRHYDVTGKKCPLYYVDHPDEWESFKDDVITYMKQNNL